MVWGEIFTVMVKVNVYVCRLFCIRIKRVCERARARAPCSKLNIDLICHDGLMWMCCLCLKEEVGVVLTCLTFGQKQEGLSPVSV